MRSRIRSFTHERRVRRPGSAGARRGVSLSPSAERHMKPYTYCGRRPRRCVHPLRCPQATTHQEKPPTVVTLIEQPLRIKFDAATSPAFESVHATSVAEAISAVREHTPSALVISASAARSESITSLATLLAKSPGVTPVAILAGVKPDDCLLTLGSCGLRHLVDVSDQDGWGRLRSLAQNPGNGTSSAITSAVMTALEESTIDAQRLFGVIVRAAPTLSTVRELAGRMRIHHSTLTSRFWRAGLPTPKKYLAMIRLVYASAFLESPSSSIADVAYQLHYSSPQSFGRNVRTLLRVTATEFRTHHCFAATIDHFVGTLLTPYRDVFKHFHPITRT